MEEQGPLRVNPELVHVSGESIVVFLPVERVGPRPAEGTLRAPAPRACELRIRGQRVIEPDGLLLHELFLFLQDPLE